MKTFKLAIIGMLLLLVSTGIKAQQSITFTWQGNGTNTRTINIMATKGTGNISVDWGITGHHSDTYNGAGNANVTLTSPNYGNTDTYDVTITATSGDFTNLDVSGTSTTNNTLSALDVSNAPALTDLRCNYNQLTELDLSANTALKLLFCQRNQLTELDLSMNTLLTQLDCSYNQLSLETLHTLSQMPSIIDLSYWTLGSQTLAPVDWAAPTADLGHELTGASYSVKWNGGLSTTALSTENYAITDGVITFLKDGTYAITITPDPAKYPSKTTMPAQVAMTYNVSGSGNEGQRITFIWSGSASRDIYIGATSGTDNISVDWGITGEDPVTGSGNGLRNVTFTSPNYGDIDSHTVTITALKGADIIELDIPNKNVSALNVTNAPALQWLDCHTNQLTELKLSTNSALKVLNCSGNPLGTLDLSANTKLTTLNCYNCGLTALDVSRNTALEILHCYTNQLAELKLSSNKALETLDCYNNQLGILDVNANAPLTYLDCYNNRLPLATLYTLSQIKSLTTQNLGTQTLSLNITTNTAVLDGIHGADTNHPTTYSVTIDYVNATASDYMIVGGVITFLHSGTYMVTTTPYPENCPSGALYPAKIVATYNVNIAIGDGQNITFTWAGNGSSTRTIYVKATSGTSNILVDWGIADHHSDVYDGKGNAETSLISPSYGNTHTYDVTITALKGTDITSLTVSANTVSALDVTRAPALTSLDCSSNQLPLSTLYMLSQITRITTQNFGMQTLDPVDLTTNTAVLDGIHGADTDHPTTYSVTINGGSTTASDYTITGGVITFLYSGTYVVTTIPDPANCPSATGAPAQVVSTYNVTIPQMPQVILTWARASDIDLIQTIRLRFSRITAFTIDWGDADGGPQPYTYTGGEDILSAPDTYKGGSDYTVKITVKSADITSLDVADQHVSVLDVTNAPALTNLFCSDNQLIALDLSANTALTTLSCYDNQLTALDVSDHTVLTDLSCTNNHNLSTLDLAGATGLTRLDCSSSGLKTLDVSTNTALTELRCYTNQLTALDVSHNTVLATLYCHENQLAMLNVGDAPITYLNCIDNQLPLSVLHALSEKDMTAGLDLDNQMLPSVDCEAGSTFDLDPAYHGATLDYIDENDRPVNLNIDYTLTDAKDVITFLKPGTYGIRVNLDKTIYPCSDSDPQIRMTYNVLGRTTWEGSNTTWDDINNWSNGIPTAYSIVTIDGSNNNVPDTGIDAITIAGLVLKNNAQVSVGNALTVTGDTKVEKVVNEDNESKWYAIGLPADGAVYYFGDNLIGGESFAAEPQLVPAPGIEGSENHGDFWLRGNYDGTAFSNIAPATVQLAAGVGYIAQYPSFFNGETVTYVMTGATFNGAAAIGLPADNTYVLVANPTLSTYEFVPPTGMYCYQLNGAGTNFDRVPDQTTTTIAPFESVIIVKNPVVLRSSISVEETDAPAGLKPIAPNNDDSVREMHYYNLQGIEVGEPNTDGIFIRKTIFESGREKTEKFVNRR